MIPRAQGSLVIVETTSNDGSDCAYYQMTRQSTGDALRECGAKEMSGGGALFCAEIIISMMINNGDWHDPMLVK